MISFRTRNESYASSLLITAILLAIGTAAWFSRPLPTETVASPAQHIRDTAKIQKDIADAKTKYADSEKLIDSTVWSGVAGDVQPTIITKLREIAKKRNLKVGNIHPGKTIEGQGLIEIPFAMTIEGTFPSAVEFVKDLEKPDLKLAVSTVQVASADAASDRVTETVNVLAYLRGTTVSAATGDKNAKKPK